ncbi:MAG: FtsQ-type POTRA domain-containing protein [Candidatus Margulisiibacteriota bacterium]
MKKPNQAPPRRKIQRPLRWYIVWGFIYFIAAACLVTWVLSLQVWRISNVEVQGSSMVDAAYIAQKADIPIGENIFFLGLKKPATAVNSIRQLESVKFHKQLPATIVIEVKERIPFAVVVVSKEANVVDREGVILKTQGLPRDDFVKILDVTQLPVVSGLTSSQVKDCKLDTAVMLAIRTAISRISAFFDNPSLQIDLHDFNNINILVSDILKVKIGTAENLKEKMDLLEVILTNLKGRWDTVVYVDVRYLNNPVVSFRK